jgi:hypothetical protein
MLIPLLFFIFWIALGNTLANRLAAWFTKNDGLSLLFRILSS